MNKIPNDLAVCFTLTSWLKDFSYSLADFENDLWRIRAQIHEYIRMAGDDKEIYPSYGPARQDSLQWIYDGLSQGYSLIFNKINLCNPIIAKLACEVERFYPEGSKVFVTAFLTPSSSNCFGYHYDEVDVVLIQIFGKKKWSVAPPVVPHPIEKMEKHTVNQKQPEEYICKTLKRNECLYIPRGHIHKGYSEGYGSLHLSVGIHSPTIADTVIRKISDLEIENDFLRKPYIAKSNELSEFTFTIENLLKSHHNKKINYEKLMEHLYIPKSFIKTIIQLNEITVNTKFKKNNGRKIKYKLLSNLSHIEIIGLLFDYGVKYEQRPRKIIPACYYSAIEAINSHDVITANIISSLSNTQINDAKKIIQLLARLGLLEILN